MAKPLTPPPDVRDSKPKARLGLFVPDGDKWRLTFPRGIIRPPADSWVGMPASDASRMQAYMRRLEAAYGELLKHPMFRKDKHASTSP